MISSNNKNFTLKLTLNGKKKKIRAPKTVSTAVFMRTIKLEENFDKMDRLHLVKELVTWICEVFNWQFKESDLSLSLTPVEILGVADELIYHVIATMDLSRKAEVVPIGSKKQST